MTLRPLFRPAVVAVGFALFAAPAPAVDPTAPAFAFGTLKPTPADAAKAKAAAWLKDAGKLDQTAFDKVWADADRSVLDRVLDSFALASPDAAAVVAATTDPMATAPASVPAVLKDAKQSAFYRANLGLGFARAAGTKKAFEESLDALNTVPADQVVDPATYYFYKGVAEHALMKKPQADASLTRLLTEVGDVPDRYRTVGTQLWAELGFWAADPKDLSNIGRLMDNSGRRLDLARPGEKTQDIQRKISFRLDELIRDMENQCKGGNCNGGNCPNGGMVAGKKPGNTTQPNRPADDSFLMGGAGKGDVDSKKLREFSESWGSLPKEKREAIVEQMAKDVDPKYKPILDDYFKALNRMHGYSK